jgi:putative tryptophan/tyrosine transport system substrate-binding protein
MKFSTVGIIITFALALCWAPLAAHAQQRGKIPLVGVLRPTSPTDPLNEAFQQGLRDLGYVEGQNIRLEYRFAEGQFERLPELAAELVRLPVDVLVTAGPGAVAAKHATDTIPIVFAVFAHLVEEGLVASLARPGGNITGSSTMAPELVGKRLELLREIVPGILRMAILWNPGRPEYAIQIKETQPWLQGSVSTWKLQRRETCWSSTAPFGPWSTRVSARRLYSTMRCSIISA